MLRIWKYADQIEKADTELKMSMRNSPKVRRKSGSLCRYRPEKLCGLNRISGSVEIITDGRWVSLSGTSGFAPTTGTIYPQAFEVVRDCLCAGIRRTDEGVEFVEILLDPCAELSSCHPYVMK